MKTSKLIILLAAFSIIAFASYRLGAKKMASAGNLIKNNIQFSGKILSYSRSHNHSYGIVKIKVIESNRREFTGSDSLGVFPYRIQGDYAEFYGYIPKAISIGDLIVLNSDEQTFTYYKSGKIEAGTMIFITAENENIQYVRANTAFK